MLPTAISLGRRPTFYEQAHASLLECHVLDFAGDLYDEHVRVRFVERLRGEQKFDSVEALVAQMGRDCDEARAAILAAAGADLSARCRPPFAHRARLRQTGQIGARRRTSRPTGDAVGRASHTGPRPSRHPSSGRPTPAEPVPAVAGLPAAGPPHDHASSDGHQVGIAVCGRGVPLVVVHGFSAEGFLYAQTPVAARRRRVQGGRHRHRRPRRHARACRPAAPTSSRYSRLLGRVIDELGIRRAVLAGHSMGGRLVTELAADEPDRAIAVHPARRHRRRDLGPDGLPVPLQPARCSPASAPCWSLDTLTTVPLFRDPRQAAEARPADGADDAPATS